LATKTLPRRRETDKPTHSPAMANCGKWENSNTFVLAAAGAAIGLNNVWQFPYLVTNFGGSAFLLAYLVALVVLGLPLMMNEILIGRRGGFSPINSVRLLIVKDACDGRWTLLGWISTIVGIVILSYLSVIAGWIIAYALRAGAGVFNGITPDGIRAMFYGFASDPEKQLFWHSLFVFVTMMISACGLNIGAQRFIRFGVPAFFAILLVLTIYCIGLTGPENSFSQLLRFEPEALGFEGIIFAAGHAMFSLGLGVGVLIVYSSHLGQSASIPRVASKVIGLDTLAGLMAAFVVISLLSMTKVRDTSGPGLIFQSIPQVLDHIPYGNFIGALFFIALILATLLSAIALVESAMSWLVESWGMTRTGAATICGLIAWFFGVVAILSFNFWGFHTEVWGIEINRGYFDIVQIISTYIMIPAAVVLGLLFVGWGLKSKILSDEIPFLSRGRLPLAVWSLRLVLPVAALYVFYQHFNINQ
jgi:NSS family neurotransmitter:Na+ symporter